MPGDVPAQRILDAFASLKPLPFEILKPDQARSQPTPVDAVMAILKEDGKPTEPEPVGKVENITIPGPAGDLPVRIYTPISADGAPMPVVLWIHGGGWVLFTVDTYDASCLDKAEQAQREVAEHLLRAFAAPVPVAGT